MNIKLIPNKDMQNELSTLVGNRKILYILCEENQVDVLKRKGKLSEQAKKRSVRVYCPTTLETYESIQDAAIKLILDPGAISKVVNGKQKSTGGYTFKKAIN